MPDEPTADQDPFERLLDLCVYAPLGFVVDARRVVPELAERGRAQAGVARMVGEFAVTWSNTKLQTVLVDAQHQAVDLLRRFGVAPAEREQAPGVPAERLAAEAPDGSSTDSHGLDAAGHHAAGRAADRALTPEKGERTPADTAEAAALAIPEYDNLSASQVVPRLDGLTADELEAVRRYERRNRHRKTILSRIAQLQAG